jgi:hypothetical protein
MWMDVNSSLQLYLAPITVQPQHVLQFNHYIYKGKQNATKQIVINEKKNYV